VGGLGADGDLFLRAADRQLNLQPAHLGDLDQNAFQDEWLKSGCTNRQVIVAGRQEGDRENSLGIGSEIALFSRGLTVDDHRRASYWRSTGSLTLPAIAPVLAVWPYTGKEQRANAVMRSKLRPTGAEIFHMASSYACAAIAMGRVN